jgi:hypothetical protein
MSQEQHRDTTHMKIQEKVMKLILLVRISRVMAFGNLLSNLDD